MVGNANIINHFFDRAIDTKYYTAKVKFTCQVLGDDEERFDQDLENAVTGKKEAFIYYFSKEEVSGSKHINIMLTVGA